MCWSDTELRIQVQGTQGTPPQPSWTQLFSHWGFCAGNGTPKGQRCNHTPYETPELFPLLTFLKFFFPSLCFIYSFKQSILQSILQKQESHTVWNYVLAQKAGNGSPFLLITKQEGSSSIKSTFQLTKFEYKGASERFPFFLASELKLCFPSELPWSYQDSLQILCLADQ